MTQKQRRKQIDARVEFIVGRDCSGLQINIMDINKVFQAAYQADDAGLNIDEAVNRRYRELSEACK